MKWTLSIVVVAGASPVLLGQSQPVCMVSLGTTLYRAGAGGVESYPNQAAEIVGLTVIPPGVSVVGCREGDVLAIENAVGGRVWRVDNARSGVPGLVEIGRVPAGLAPCDIAFARGSLFGVSWGADVYQFTLDSFQQIGQTIALQPTTAGIGGMTFDGTASWYFTNGNTNRLVRVGDPPTLAGWTAVGNAGVDFDNSDLEFYHGRLWGAVRTPVSADGRLVIGTFDVLSGVFTAAWDVAGAPAAMPIGLATFNPACVGIDTQPAQATACYAGTAGFSVAAAGVGPFSYEWQVFNGGQWLALGSSPTALQCGGSAHASPPDAPATQIGITPCAALFSYQVRCVVTNACGRAASDAATYSICYANCDCSTAAPVLNVNDFSCFLNKFAAQDTYANCSLSTSPPILNVLDFICFLNAFAAGCP